MHVREIDEIGFSSRPVLSSGVATNWNIVHACRDCLNADPEDVILPDGQ